MKSLILVASTISSIVLILLLTRKSHSRLNGATLNPDRVHATSILGGVTERNVSQDFRGGRLTAFLGGVEISVPQHWNVKKDVQPIAGGVDDRRPLVRHHDDDDGPPDNAPDLVVTGSVLLGGLLIRD